MVEAAVGLICLRTIILPPAYTRIQRNGETAVSGSTELLLMRNIQCS